MKTAKVQHPPTEEEAMAAKKKIAEKKIYGNKTKFVLGLPRDMSAKQVVSEGKKQGIVLSEAHVYKIRSTAKSKGATPAPKRGRGAKAAAPAKGGAAKGGAGVSKRDFVLSFGPEVKASSSAPRTRVLVCRRPTCTPSAVPVRPLRVVVQVAPLRRPARCRRARPMPSRA